MYKVDSFFIPLQGSILPQLPEQPSTIHQEKQLSPIVYGISID